MVLDRSSLIQYLIYKHKYSTYLEIGTQRGLSFFPIRCKRKMAVDPVFMVDFRQKWSWIIKNPSNLRNKYFEMTSEDFFRKNENLLKSKWKPDIILIDGLHTFKAALKDILNSLRVMDLSGTIVVHDCFPPHQAAAEPGEDAEEVALRSEKIEGWTGEWCGDTWKAMAYLKGKFPEELKVAVLKEDYGLGIVQLSTHLPQNIDLDYDFFDQIKSLKYEDLLKDPEQLIGLTKSEIYKDL